MIVSLKRQADLGAFLSMSDKHERRTALVSTLRDFARENQRGVQSWLRARSQQGGVIAVRPFWIFNGFALRAQPDVILDLAEQPAVLSIRPDRIFQAPETVHAVDSIEPNLTQVNAPALWDLGYTGQGVVIAVVDTGVSLSHPDLGGRWRAGDNSWYDPYGEHPDIPYDYSGHGTAAAGVALGGDASGSSIGVAPGAQWIAAKIFDDSGSATVQGIHAAFEWLLDPDGNPLTDDLPDVVNNSWAMASPSDCYTEFQPDLQALLAAEILPVFAAGNFGPQGSSDVSPANNPEALAVGAVDGDDVIYTSSSRGPSSCGDGSVIYPGLVAPGVDIYTASLSGAYTTESGTSLSAPHASGVLALLIQAFPYLTAGDQRQALLDSAVDLGDAGPDNTYGYGRLDALAAYNWALLNYKTPTPSLTPTLTGTPTQTLTPTLTETPTQTLTPTNTGTASATPTVTLTQTTTPTPVAPTEQVRFPRIFRDYLIPSFRLVPSATPTP